MAVPVVLSRIPALFVTSRFIVCVPIPKLEENRGRVLTFTPSICHCRAFICPPPDRLLELSKSIGTLLFDVGRFKGRLFVTDLPPPLITNDAVGRPLIVNCALATCETVPEPTIRMK